MWPCRANIVGGIHCFWRLQCLPPVVTGALDTCRSTALNPHCTLKIRLAQAFCAQSSVCHGARPSLPPAIVKATLLYDLNPRHDFRIKTSRHLEQFLGHSCLVSKACSSSYIVPYMERRRPDEARKVSNTKTLSLKSVPVNFPIPPSESNAVEVRPGLLDHVPPGTSGVTVQDLDPPLILPESDTDTVVRRWSVSICLCLQ